MQEGVFLSCLRNLRASLNLSSSVVEAGGGQECLLSNGRTFLKNLKQNVPQKTWKDRSGHQADYSLTHPSQLPCLVSCWLAQSTKFHISSSVTAKVEHKDVLSCVLRHLNRISALRKEKKNPERKYPQPNPCIFSECMGPWQPLHFVSHKILTIPKDTQTKPFKYSPREVHILW